MADVSQGLEPVSQKAQEAAERVRAAHAENKQKLQEAIEQAKSNATHFALSAIDEAEYAVLEAVLARADADEAQSNLG
ncbi:hypothetical protein ACFRCW_33065 [Streptomyces sp. NPDC056653]|uniref:hypothetical protein n=1 Tax=unclassified Streptomyces TaxID=2593676 RepID=UPI0033B29567